MVKSLLLTVLLLFTLQTQAATLKVAVAANFKPVLKKLAPQFEQQYKIKLSLSSASTGVLYAQIRHGAPFDVFLAGDEKRPQLLEQEDRIVADSRQSYAVGQLALWYTGKEPNKVDQKLLQQWTGKIAMANAKIAPYGLAAKSVLEQLDLWKSKRSQLIKGSNIAQTQQFIESGNVNLGFVALSQVKAMGKLNGKAEHYWLLPQSWYAKINQQAVLLTPRGQAKRQKTGAKTFLNWLLSAKIQKQIITAGYAPIQGQ
jgi:molybdate transport system substrate-binding protein